MSLLYAATTTVVKTAFQIACRIDNAELAKIPAKGPLILVVNHINSIEPPVIFTQLTPRPVAGVAKIESWDNPLLAFLFNTWKIIPIRREEMDWTAFQKVRESLARGAILAMAPEGTRSYDGVMARGKPGVVLMAIKTGAPIQAVAAYGHEVFWNKFPFHRTDFIIRVGRTFKIDLHGEALTKELSQQITDEIMHQLAALMPERYRGYYRRPGKASAAHLVFTGDD